MTAVETDTPNPTVRETRGPWDIPDLSLADFLRARLAEEEQAARAATAGPWHWTESSFDGDTQLLGDGDACVITASGNEYPELTIERPDAEHIARHDPARVLADVEARRAVLDRLVHDIRDTLHGTGEYSADCSCGWTASDIGPGQFDIYADRHRDEVGYDAAVTDGVLRLLALPHAEHPDYRAEWAPSR